ncbi:MAG: SPOR domain-containing protein [Prevotella sp.]
MIEIEKHIVKLLLDNDCVIVPEFGGFMTHHVDSFYDENDNMFYPPQRTLGFNPQLKMNDSMLVQSFIEAYDISYPEALTRIEDNVEELKSQLETDGCYEIYGLGSIILRSDGYYEFQPCEAGILTPDLYGLSSFSSNLIYKTDIKQLKNSDNTVSDNHNVSSNVVENDSSSDSKEQDSVPQLSEILRSASDNNIAWLHKLAVACILLALIVLFPSTTGDKGFAGLQKSNIDTNMLFEMMPKDITLGKPDFKNISERLNNENTACEQSSNVDIDNVAPADTKVEKPETYYSIVLASRVSKNNAEAYVANLNKQGYDKARVYQDKKFVKVIYGRFATQADAHRELNKLNDNAEFADAWVTNITVTE